MVGGGRHSSLLLGVSDRQLPVDGAVRMPRMQSRAVARPDDCIASGDRSAGRCREADLRI